mmetsp:Transcript_121311/g.210876  ORF Transcript_121311/g.210876 Transcript_121311/m.210876 type:complete len:93 (+) Transcript_121311:1122-1400(+)
MRVLPSAAKHVWRARSASLKQSEAFLGRLLAETRSQRRTCSDAITRSIQGSRVGGSMGTGGLPLTNLVKGFPQKSPSCTVQLPLQVWPKLAL